MPVNITIQKRSGNSILVGSQMWTACKEAEPTRVYTSSGKEMVLKCCWHSAERFTNEGKLLVLVKTFFHGLLFYWHSAEQFTNEGKLIVLARNFPPRIICNWHLVKQFTNEGNFICFDYTFLLQYYFLLALC